MAGSSAFANYKKVKGSDRLKKYEALSEYVKTDAFLSKKKDLENKNRFKESQQYKDLQAFEQLEANKDIKWYKECVKTNAFADANKWQLTFSDEFKGSKLDSSKWLTGYYWGKKTAGVTYSLADERQKFEDGNAVVGSNGLTISTAPAKPMVRYGRHRLAASSKPLSTLLPRSSTQATASARSSASSCSRLKSMESRALSPTTSGSVPTATSRSTSPPSA